ncbi:MAG: hypothetical protein PHX34_00705 [Candidatus Shapirobacteria bacterium]|nr:hypothetical protein [Candidatus Shapirobacteria bacterium]
MSCDCPKCDCKTNNSSSFIFGIVLGAIVGAIIAIVIYRQNKGKIFNDLQKKLEDFFKNLIGNQNKSSSKTKSKNFFIKKPVFETKTEGSKANKSEIVFVKKRSIPKTFVKSKK